jgi:hypothetical protein
MVFPCSAIDNRFFENYQIILLKFLIAKLWGSMSQSSNIVIAIDQLF